MNSGLRPLLNRILPMLLLAWGAYLGYDFYSFQNDAESPFHQKQSQLEQEKQQITTVQGELREAKEFLKNLEAKKAELRRYSEQLNGMKNTLTEVLDIPGLMRLIVTEANRVGMKVVGLKPLKLKKEVYYTEQSFELNFKGLYVQMLLLLERLSQSREIVRVDTFAIKPKTNSRDRFVELDGTIEIKAYQYLGTREDDLFKSGDGSVLTQGNAAGGSAPASVSGADGSTGAPKPPAGAKSMAGDEG